MNEIICYGFLEKGTGKHQSNTIYSTGGVLPTQYAQQYKNPPMIVVTGSRTVLTQTTTKEQPLRTISKNTDGSSLSKPGIDEYHKRPRMVGVIDDGFEHDNRVYSEFGCCPVITARDYKGPLKVLVNENAEIKADNSDRADG